MKYICLVYQEDKHLEDLSQPEMERIVGECGAWVNSLEESGKHVMSHGLQSVRTATTLRQRDGEILMTDGPFAETKEFLGGFTILEARDLNEALQQASKLTKACGGTVEVRPVMDPDSEMTEPLDRKLAQVLRGSKSRETQETR